MRTSAAGSIGGAVQAKRFYSVSEAAELFGLSEPTVYRAIRAGEFPAVRVRGRYVIPAKAIDQMESAALVNGLVDSADHTPPATSPVADGRREGGGPGAYR